MEEVLYFGPPMAAGLILGVIVGRFWVLLVPLALGLLFWIVAGNDGDGEIPGWFLGLVVTALIGVGTTFGVLLRILWRVRPAGADGDDPA